MLEARSVRIPGRGGAADYAARLLAALGAQPLRSEAAKAPAPAFAWAQSGAMALSGHAEAAPRLAPGPLAACADGALAALRALSGAAAALPRDGGALLGERAAAFGYTRAGRTSPSGSCRLLRGADGWLALNLPRPDDRACLPAWLECEPSADDAWKLAERGVAVRGISELVQRAGWLGLAAAPALPPAPAREWLRAHTLGPARAAVETLPARPPRLLLDLSALWAGPLAAELCAAAGFRVVKVESTARPDGARRGPPALYDVWNASKASVALDLRTERGRAALLALAQRADAIVESTRPRALAQLGLDAVRWLAAAPGRSWLSLTGYGRDDAPPGRVAFGDDAAAAAGLAVAAGDLGGPLFCGDAIADPLAGLHAALALLASQLAGGGHLLDVALRDVVAHALGFEAEDVDGEVIATPDGYAVQCGGRRVAVAAPRLRRAARRARALGADTAALCAELGVPC